VNLDGPLVVPSEEGHIHQGREAVRRSPLAEESVVRTALEVLEAAVLPYTGQAEDHLAADRSHPVQAILEDQAQGRNRTSLEILSASVEGHASHRGREKDGYRNHTCLAKELVTSESGSAVCASVRGQATAVDQGDHRDRVVKARARAICGWGMLFAPLLLRLREWSFR
jgi:hypothetical protein